MEKKEQDVREGLEESVWKGWGGCEEGREEGQTIWWGDGRAYKMDAAAKEGSEKAAMETRTEAEVKPRHARHCHIVVARHQPDTHGGEGAAGRWWNPE